MSFVTCAIFWIFQGSHHRREDRRRERDSSESEEDVPRRHIKKEREDPGYDRHHHGEPSRWEDEDERRRMREQNRDRRKHDQERREKWRDRQKGRERGEKHEWGKPQEVKVKEEKPKEKEKPNFKLSGKLTEETNMFRGIVIKYSEPPEARKPKRRWRLYPFKGDEALPVLHLHRQSAYLLGRERKVADIPIDHPSCSKQHAAFQFRLVPFKREDGTMGRRIRPYIIDLGSANGTHVNNKRIDPERYVELFERDVIKFGFSSREYVLLHDKTDTSEINDDDVTEGH